MACQTSRGPKPPKPSPKPRPPLTADMLEDMEIHRTGLNIRSLIGQECKPLTPKPKPPPCADGERGFDDQHILGTRFMIVHAPDTKPKPDPKPDPKPKPKPKPKPDADNRSRVALGNGNTLATRYHGPQPPPDGDDKK